MQCNFDTHARRLLELIEVRDCIIGVTLPTPYDAPSLVVRRARVSRSTAVRYNLEFFRFQQRDPELEEGARSVLCYDRS